MKGVHQFLRLAYGAAGAQGTDHPSIDDVFGPLAHFAPLEHLAAWSQDSQTYFQELARAREPKQGNGRSCTRTSRAHRSRPAQQAVQNTFFEAYRFYHRPGSQNPDLPDQVHRAEPDR